MIDYIKGTIVELTPAYVVIDVFGIGYHCNISLTTYSMLSGERIEEKLFIYENIREDAHTLYGFLDKRERELFLLLISTAGIGANTARVILSSLNPEELTSVIASGDVNTLNKIKGIGLKTAQRLIVDLKDKVAKTTASSDSLLFLGKPDSGIRQEAVMALSMLGFSTANSQKVVDKILSQEEDIPVEQVIKQALKML